jgi:hypothetical protein
MKSVLCWVGGGVAGAALAKKHRVKGAVLGALLVGGFGDVLIERNDPNYTGLPPKTN